MGKRGTPPAGEAKTLLGARRGQETKPNPDYGVGFPRRGA